MQSSPHRVRLSQALVKCDDEVMEVILGGADFLALHAANFEGEQPVGRNRAKDPGNPVLLDLVKSQFDTDLWPRMPVDGEVGAGELALFG